MIVELRGSGDGEMLDECGLGVSMRVEGVEPIMSMIDDLHYYCRGNLYDYEKPITNN